MQIFKPAAFGGVANTTVCGRVRNDQEDYNVADTQADVTCKFCLRAIETKTYGARWIGWKPER